MWEIVNAILYQARTGHVAAPAGGEGDRGVVGSWPSQRCELVAQRAWIHLMAEAHARVVALQPQS
jgi:hypothetical protein